MRIAKLLSYLNPFELNIRPRLVRISLWLIAIALFGQKIASDAQNANREKETGVCGPVPYSDVLDSYMPFETYFDLESAEECGRGLNKPVLAYFTGHTVSSSRRHEVGMATEKVSQLLADSFVVASLYVDEWQDAMPHHWIVDRADTLRRIGQINIHLQMTRFNQNGQPFFFILDRNGEVLALWGGYQSDFAKHFYKFLKEGLNAYRASDS